MKESLWLITKNRLHNSTRAVAGGARKILVRKRTQKERNRLVSFQIYKLKLAGNPVLVVTFSVSRKNKERERYRVGKEGKSWVGVRDRGIA